ncbi:MAG: hypothetical protein QNJ98_00605 [Planctomycetota bacterium]|nr:hypothetical protein [Planctomycetota bacterium]
MRIKHLVIGLAFLTIAGCGCGDSGPSSPSATTPAYSISIEVPPCEFPCTPETQQECLIDVVFAIDDSEFMNRPFGMTAGLPQVPQGDSRSRSVVAQRIFADTQARLLAKINEAKQNGLIPQDVIIDLAFAVVRYEDFGGTTVPYQGEPGTIDAGARPYFLQMPLLRELHPSFGVNFAQALVESTPLNNGNPVVTAGTPPRQDPQSAIEMLHQVATGAGIDGNLANGTVDNGPPCSPTAKGTVAGSFTDVPAVTYAANGQDPQDANRPLFLVQDENGAGVQTCISSGNEGGVGFRPNSLRWVIFASDIATVAPFRDSNGQPADPASNADAATVSTPEGSVPATAFDGVTGRYGAAGMMPVPPVGTATFSPAYAAGVEQTVNELVGAGIEVMALGAGGAQPGQTKPNVPPANDPDPNREPAIIAPSAPDFTPFTMESAISILTGSEVTDETTPANPGPFPAVFNLGTVGAVDLLNQDPIVPTMSATIVNDDLIDALIERIVARIAEKEPTQMPGDCPQLPELTASITITLNESQGDGTDNYFRATAPVTPVSLTIPSYYRDTVTNEIFTVDAGGNRVPLAAVPAPVRVQLADNIAYLLRDPNLLLGNNPLPLDMLSFNVNAVEQSISNDTTENAQRVATLRTKLPAFLSSGQVTIQAQRIPANPNLRNAVLLPGASSGYCLIYQEVTGGIGPFPEERVGATCPAQP